MSCVFILLSLKISHHLVTTHNRKSDNSTGRPVFGSSLTSVKYAVLLTYTVELDQVEQQPTKTLQQQSMELFKELVRKKNDQPSSSQLQTGHTHTIPMQYKNKKHLLHSSFTVERNGYFGGRQQQDLKPQPFLWLQSNWGEGVIPDDAAGFKVSPEHAELLRFEGICINLHMRN